MICRMNIYSAYGKLQSEDGHEHLIQMEAVPHRGDWIVISGTSFEVAKVVWKLVADRANMQPHLECVVR